MSLALLKTSYLTHATIRHIAEYFPKVPFNSCKWIMTAKLSVFQRFTFYGTPGAFSSENGEAQLLFSTILKRQ